MDKIYFLRLKKNRFGGAEKYLSRLAKELERQGVDFEIIHSKTPSFLASWMRALIFNMEVCLKKRGFYFSLDRISCPDIYRAGDGVHKVFMKVKGRKTNPLNLVYLYLEKRAFRNAKKIIANSKKVKREIVENYFVEESKIEVVYNGIEPEEFDEKVSKRKIVNEFSIDPSKKIILFVGSGFERKGADRFLNILSSLKNDFYAFVVGKEKNIKYYIDLAKKLKLEEKVFFTGPREDVRDFYISADILLFPTKYEPFSNVVLEAMSYKNAVITTEDNGACEILEEKFVIFGRNDSKAASLIDELIENERFLEEVKERNYKKVRNFTMEKNAKETVRIIKSLLREEKK